LFIASVLHVLKRKDLDTDEEKKLQINKYSREWYQQLQSLSQYETPNTFSNQLEMIISKIYNQITIYLWKILCDHDVKCLFQDLRRCYLLDNDVFQAWLSNGALIILQQYTGLSIETANDLSILFQKMENEFPCMDSVTIGISASKHSLSSMATIGTTTTISKTTIGYEQLLEQISTLKDQWHDHLRVNTVVKWPLNLLISEEILELYNQIWQFLLLVKRVQMELNDSYMTLMKDGSKDNGYKRLLQLRLPMQFLVDHIWYYLGIDVIGTQFSQFEQFLGESCHSFQECRTYHEQTLMKIHKNMFLSKGGQMVRATLFKLLDIILSFTHIVRTENISAYLNDIEMNWRHQMNQFWHLLENGTDREVSVLCLRVDYNGWFSSMKATSTSLMID
jgi:gamma-tubulin complex component 4